MFGQLTILAPGLLGASLGLAARAHSLADRIVVWARRVEARLEVAAQPWCSAAPDRLEEAVREADLTIVCAPVEAIVPLIEQIAPHLPERALVTDVGSTKSLICRHAPAHLPPGRHFVGSHPMAGSDRGGLAHATAGLFRSRPCFVTPVPDTSPEAVKAVVRFWRDLDMQVGTLSPEAHDEIVAQVSHLPHLIATVLCNHLAGKDPAWAEFSGPGLADSTRIAAGNPALWQAIFEQNREEVLRAISGFEHELQIFKSALANERGFAVRHLLERGKKFRDRLS